MKRKTKDGLVNGLICSAAFIAVGILVWIIGFIVIKGLPGISLHFLTADYEDKTTYVTVQTDVIPEEFRQGTQEKLSVTLEKDDTGNLIVKDIESDSPLKNARNLKGEIYKIEKKDIITKIEQESSNVLKLKVTRPGGGIFPMLVTTLYMILLSLAIAAPIGILSAIYLIEYAKPGPLMRLIHFAIQNLAGIPSIIYGLFGSLFFVKVCGMQYSILAGALTLSIMLLPAMITTTEEALKTVPMGYRQSSLGLGATKLQTISRVVLPNALPGILTAVLLSIGRVVGESAALLLTAGTVAQIPKAFFGNSASGATLTIKMYTLMKEENDLTTACAIGIVLLFVIIILNLLSKKAAAKLVKI